MGGQIPEIDGGYTEPRECEHEHTRPIARLFGRGKVQCQDCEEYLDYDGDEDD